MRKNYLLVMLLVLMVGFIGCEAKVAEALEDFVYDKSKVSVEVEGNYEQKDIDDLQIISVELGSILGGNITVQTNDLVLKSALVKLGYDITENTTPYVLIGVANLSFTQDYAGAISTPGGNAGTTLLRQEYDEAALVYGLGIQGDLAQYEGVIIGYDIRYLHTSGEETDEAIELLPDIISGLKAGNKVDATYDEVSGTLLASKKIDLKKGEDEIDDRKVKIDSITPYVGYRASLVAVNLDSELGIGCIKLGNEANYKKVGHNAVAGFKAQINDSIDIKVGGIFGTDLGGAVAVAYNF